MADSSYTVGRKYCQSSSLDVKGGSIVGISDRKIPAITSADPPTVHRRFSLFLLHLTRIFQAISGVGGSPSDRGRTLPVQNGIEPIRDRETEASTRTWYVLLVFHNAFGTFEYWEASLFVALRLWNRWRARRERRRSRW